MAALNENAITRLASVPSWSSQGAAGTETSLYTCPTGKVALITHVIMRVISASMATCVVTFGSITGDVNQFRGDTTLTNLDGTTKYAVIHMQAGTRNTPDGGTLVTAGTSFGVEVTTADADGGSATIDVFGMLYDA